MRSRSWVAFLGVALLLDVTLLSLSASADKLEPMADADLDKLIRQEHYVVVLFTGKEEDAASEKLETELAAVREDLVDSLNAWVVKAEAGSALKQLFTPEEVPAIVFFRNQIPVIYDGAANEEEMLETLQAYKEPCTKDLIDTNFEHLTQASTGATTGDWFVLFFKDECEECDRLRARFESLACRFRGRINVARMNRGGTGAVTGRRFAVAGAPEIIFFRLGRMYRYSIGKFDIPSMSSFITGWYKNVQAESIPIPKSPFDDLVSLCVDYLRDYPFLFALIFGVPLLLGAAFYFLMKSDEKKVKKKKKKAT